MLGARRVPDPVRVVPGLAQISGYFLEHEPRVLLGSRGLHLRPIRALHLTRQQRRPSDDENRDDEADQQFHERETAPPQNAAHHRRWSP